MIELSTSSSNESQPDCKEVGLPSKCPRPKQKTLKFTNYDLIGIDLDHTLARYNLKHLFEAHHEFMIGYLKKHKHGYKQLSRRMTEQEIDFLSKGLFADPVRGNLLKADENGIIVRASHGLEELSKEQIVRDYGEKKEWAPIKGFIGDKVESWSKGLLSGTKAFIDFTDLALSLVFAKAVSTRTKHVDSAWSDVMESILAMYRPNSKYIDHFKSDKAYYVHKSGDKVGDWLKALRRHSQVALITSAHSASAKTTMERSLGPDYLNYFDILIYDSCKPSFFLENRPFFSLAGQQTQFEGKGEYSGGSSVLMEKYFSEKLSRDPRLLYIGDNLINDIVAPSMDVVAIVEELTPEGFFPGSHPHANYISSSFWGSLFREGSTPTVFGNAIFEQALFAAPCIEYFAEHPTDHEFTPFWQEHPSPGPSSSNERKTRSNSSKPLN